MIQVVILFLVAMVVLAIVGRMKRGGVKQLGHKKCRHCGTPLIGKGPCACGKEN